MNINCLLYIYISVGFWSEWSSYSGCSKTCDIGNKYRSRVCKGGPCSGDTHETQLCVIQDCPKAKSNYILHYFVMLCLKLFFKSRDMCLVGVIK